MRGVSLEEISAATRISTRFLEALENEQWDRLPGGAFNRGFIRSIARFLGIDEDALVAEYAFERKDAENTRSATEHSEEIPRNWRPVAAVVVVVALLIAGGLFAYHRYGARIAARLHARFAAASVDSYSSAAAKLPSAAGASAVAKESPGSSDVAPVAAAMALSIQASKPVDVTVVADGKTAFEGSLQANDMKLFEARDSFEIGASESSALMLTLNGRVVPSSGTPGQPAKITLTRNDLQPAAEVSH